jgi:hypothetical protein
MLDGSPLSSLMLSHHPHRVKEQETQCVQRPPSARMSLTAPTYTKDNQALPTDTRIRSTLHCLAKEPTTGVHMCKRTTKRTHKPKEACGTDTHSKHLTHD